MVKAVIFDLDGTLVDTKSAVVKSFQRVLREVGCVVSDDFLERRIGIGTKKTIIAAFRECNIRFNVLMLDTVSKEKIRIQRELTKIVSLFDGVIELLDALYGRARIALATMSNRKVVDKILSEKGIETYFDVVVTGDEVSNTKPDPEVFLLSARKMEIKSEDCVVIEDSVFGVKAAKEANMKCIAVSSGVYSGKELLEEEPDMVIGSLNEKNKILDFIFNNK
jgi:HAD superfamily hydrolase (TIGR01509 family)